MGESRDRGLVLEAASPSVFRTNGFRLLRMPVDASPRILKRRTSELRLLLELPDDEELVVQRLFPFDRVLLVHPLALDDIRGIEQRLQDSQKRLLEEFFWFWPCSARPGSEDMSLTAVISGEIATAVSLWSKAERERGVEGCAARHNLSTYYYACVLNHESYLIHSQPPSPEREEILDAVAPLWENCLRRWDNIMKTDSEWDLLKDRVESLADPRLDASFVNVIRDVLPQALDKVNADLAVAFADRGDGASASRHITFITQTQSDRDDIAKTLTDATQKQRERLVATVADMTRRVNEKPTLGAEVILQSLASIRHDAQTMELLLGRTGAGTETAAKRLREGQTLQTDLADALDQVADSVIDCQITYARATEDWKKSLTILQEAKRYATSEKVKERLRENLKIVEDNSVHVEAWGQWMQLQNQIERAAVTPSARLGVFRERALPVLKQALTDPTKPLASRQGIGDVAARFLRKLSLDANNSFGDVDAAVSILDQAIDVVRGQELRDSLMDDRKLLTKRIADAASGAVSYRRGQYMSETDWDHVWEMLMNALMTPGGISAWYAAARQLLTAGERILMSVPFGQKSKELWNRLPAPCREALPQVFPLMAPGFINHAKVATDIDVGPTSLGCDGRSCPIQDVTGFEGGFPIAALRTSSGSTITIDFRRLCDGVGRGDEMQAQVLMGLAHHRAAPVLSALSTRVLPQVTRRIAYAVLEGTPYRLTPPEGSSLVTTREYVEYPDSSPSLWRRKPPIRISLSDALCVVKDGVLTVQKDGDSSIPIYTCKVSGTWNSLVIDDAIAMIRGYISDNDIKFTEAPDTGARRTA